MRSQSGFSCASACLRVSTLPTLMHHFAHSASPDGLTAWPTGRPCATSSSTRRQWNACWMHTAPSSLRRASLSRGMSSRSATSTATSTGRAGLTATSATNCCRYTRWQHSTCTISPSPS